MPENENNIGWNFDNSYVRLGEGFYDKNRATKVEKPELEIFNYKLAEELGLNFGGIHEADIAQMLCGNVLPDGAEVVSQAYAGHQYGHFNVLGDGRAHLLGEHVFADGKRVDIQLKGSGVTAYAKRGDGRAALGPMLREYVISEAMHNLNIATTRSLAVVKTGEPVFRESMLQGAVLTRVAASHIRFGSFEYFAAKKDPQGLKALADYTINRHFPECLQEENCYLAFLKKVMERQITLVNDWLRVGFVHGVMNTDNMSVAGETIDYGPCAFMDVYNPQTVFSSIDRNGRYAYGNQPHIAQWNLARFAEALLPLLADEVKEAAELAEAVIDSFSDLFQADWIEMMKRKLGLFGENKNDLALIGDLLKWMQRNELDYTNVFRDLSADEKAVGEVFAGEEFEAWFAKWQDRLGENAKPKKASICLMRANNPFVVPRNHMVEEALAEAEERSDLSKFNALLDALKDPYKSREGLEGFASPPAEVDAGYRTFCGT